MTDNPALSGADWLVEESGVDDAVACARETRFTVGNGYLGTRGSLVESRRGAWPATYIAGVFDQRDGTVIDLVNGPDWLATRIEVDGQVLDVDNCKVLSHTQTLDLQTAILYRTTEFEDAAGRRTQLATLRLASLANPHLVATRLEITPLDHDPHITIETGINGRTSNLDQTPYPDFDRFDPLERWDKWTRTTHLRREHAEATSSTALLQMRTYDRDIQLCHAMALASPTGAFRGQGRSAGDSVTCIVEFDAQAGTPHVLDKFVGIATSRDHDASGDNPAGRATGSASAALSAGWDAVVAEHQAAWAAVWQDCDCVIANDPDATRALRFNIYHLLIAASPTDPTVSVGAKSLSGEGYKGHVFWDTEIFMLPFFTFSQPGTARTLLQYRHETLPGAQENARSNGFEGAQFAWESADTGTETTPKWTHDGKHRIWTGEEEVHITADVVYAMDTYVQATGDTAFQREFAIPIAFEAARFWATRLEHNPERDDYELTSVIGPDEFHEHVDNNHFTNVFAKWNLERAADLAEDAALQTSANDSPTDDEVAQWRAIAKKVHIGSPGADGIIEQFQGYHDLDDATIVEWDENDMPAYPDGYDHFNAGSTTLVKQPDVLMLMFLLPDLFTADVVGANYDFYEARTLHKSSLSPAIHAIMGIEVRSPEKAVQYFWRSALVDLDDNQGNTRDGIHIASAGGTWMAAVAGFGGFRVRSGRPAFDPWLPAQWDELSFRLAWHGHRLDVRVSHQEISFQWPASAEPLVVQVSGREHRLEPGGTSSIPYDTRD